MNPCYCSRLKEGSAEPENPLSVRTNRQDASDRRVSAPNYSAVGAERRILSCHHRPGVTTRRDARQPASVQIAADHEEHDAPDRLQSACFSSGPVGGCPSRPRCDQAADTLRAGEEHLGADNLSTGRVVGESVSAGPRLKRHPHSVPCGTRTALATRPPVLRKAPPAMATSASKCIHPMPILGGEPGPLISDVLGKGTLHVDQLVDAPLHPGVLTIQPVAERPERTSG